MKHVQLSGGFVAIVDDEDFDKVNKHHWFASTHGNTVYGKRIIRLPGGKRTCEYLHQVIATPESGFEVDHIDGNGLNNQKSNLQVVTHRENQQNRHHEKSSRFPGVTWDRNKQRWKAAIQVNGIITHLGNFTEEADAAAAYRKACDSLIIPVPQGNKAVCMGTCMCQPENHCGHGACGKHIETPDIISADDLQAELAKTPFADTEPFDASQFVNDIVGS